MNSVQNVGSLGNQSISVHTIFTMLAYLISVPAVIPSTHVNRRSDGLSSTITTFIFELALAGIKSFTNLLDALLKAVCTGALRTET